MKHTFLRSVILTLSLLIGGSEFLFSSDKSLSTFLFALKSNINPLEISKTRNSLTVDNSSIQNFIDTHDIENIEPWLMGANENDFDGNVYLNRIYRVYIGENRSDIDYLISTMDSNLEAIYAEPEYLRKPLYVPNDPAFDLQCSMPSVKAIQAWDFWDIPNVMPADGQEVLLASVDTGVDYTHPDLVANIWVNQGEIPSYITDDQELFQIVDSDGDGKISSLEMISEFIMADLNEDGQVNLKDIFAEGSPYIDFQDNDGNGYADDLIGWDPAGTWTTQTDYDNDPFPKIDGAATDGGTWAHGSHVAGILAATSDNGIGMASTVFNGKIMSIKTSTDGQNTDDPGIQNGYDGILYAAKAGYYAGTLTIINNSWGGGGYSNSEQSVINTAHNTYGAVVVASAGNGSNTGNEEQYETGYPASYENVISVCAIGCNGQWGGWASYHPTVDLAAPGESIYSAIIGSGYASWNGSSMAGPNAASCIGLLKAFYPDMDNDQLIERITSTADRFIYDRNPEYETCNGYAGNDCLGKGMVDAYKAIGIEIAPNIAILSTNIIEEIDNADGDGVVNPGEHFSINISLENQQGWQNATNINAVLSTDYEGVTIGTNSANCASLDAGQSCAAQYDFALSDDVALGDIEFNLLTTASGPDNYAFEANLIFDVNVSLHQAGFPADVSGELISSAAIMGDHIVSSDKAGFVHQFNFDGTEVFDNVFPFETGDQNWGSPATTNDGSNIYFTSKSGSVFNYSNLGMESWDTEGFVTATPALGTLNASQDDDLVLAQYGGDRLLFAYEDGNSQINLDGFPVLLDEKVQRGVALADFNGNGFDDIVVGTDDEFIHLIYDDGTIAWSYETGGDIRVAPSVLELNTGEKIILAGSKDDNFYALNSDGTVRFMVETEDDILSEASIVDVDGVGPVIFFSSGNMVYAVETDGDFYLDWPMTVNGEVTSSIVFSEVNGQDYAIFGDEAGYVHMYTLSGQSYDNFPINYGFPFKGTPTIYDTDNDGDLEIIIGSTQSLVSIDIKESGSAEGYWNTHRSNMQRNGHFISNLDALDISDQIIDYEFALYNAYPNPFNPTTTIEYEVPFSMDVVLNVYDISGKLVKTLVNDMKNTGKHSIVWDGTTQYGNSVANGMYIYKLISSENISISNKMILLK
tara:strand:- start:1404 stop:4850 length:3447 start_codon:yes stop_codon:yes gene_type:complete